jgi:cobalt/nickel transport protein
MKRGLASGWPRGWTAALIILMVLCPLGILLTWDYGSAWGEWGNVGGWAPMQWWTAPMPDYGFAGWTDKASASAAYILSAAVGVVLVAGISYGAGWLLARKKAEAERKGPG